MDTPVIALVAAHLEAGRVERWRRGAYAVADTYIDALRRAGARPLIVPPGDDAAPESFLALVSGLLLIGGGDLEPSRYGHSEHPEVGGVEPDRDELELGLLRAADRLGVPTLAVCRGAQALNVAFGGTLHPHLPDVEGIELHGRSAGLESVPHPVRLTHGSRVADACGSAHVAVASRHHQGIDQLGQGLVATGWAPDGLVEAIERQDGWMVGVQWHPEETAADDGAQQGLFNELSQQAARIGPAGGSGPRAARPGSRARRPPRRSRP